MADGRRKAEDALRALIAEAKADPEWVEDGGTAIPGGTVTKGKNGFLLIERPSLPKSAEPSGS